MRTLSDSLMEMRRHLGDYEHTGCELAPQAVQSIRASLRDLTLLARRQEAEIDRLRRGGADAALDAGLAIASEALRPGTNLRLFPPAFRGFEDGRSA